MKIFTLPSFEDYKLPELSKCAELEPPKGTLAINNHEFYCQHELDPECYEQPFWQQLIQTIVNFFCRH